MSYRSYLLRLIMPFAVMVVLVVALSGYLIYKSGVTAARQQQILELSDDTSLLAELISRAASPTDDALKSRLVEDGAFRHVRYTIIDVGGAVIFDSEVPLDKLNNHNDRPEIVAARANGTGQSVRTSTSQSIVNIYTAQSVPTKPGIIVRTSRPERTKLNVDGHWLALLVGAIAISLIILSWLTALLHHRWIDPVRRLAEAADGMAAGNWETRATPSGAAELRAFSGKLNLVAQRAQQQLQDLQQQRTDLARLVDSLPDPILLTDKENRVVLLNELAAKFLQISSEQAIGARFFSVLGEPRLLDLYEHVINQPAHIRLPHMREIRVFRGGQRGTYQAVAVRMPAGGLVLVLRDVTRLASTVQMKTDFVANASHELRTPIAAIKIAFETLREVYREDPQQTDRCLEIIEGHLKRLEDLLQDLLDLSKVENAEIKPEIREVRGGDVLTILRNTMGALARNKQIDLHIEGDESATFYSDRRLLDLVLKNLVENSVKYTPTGGRVGVKLSREGEAESSQIVMRVSDSGIGIPPQHLERVFERFYQVDSARSGASGRGTGLGLAIVKHAVNALGGQVNIDSTVGVGTTVTCSFPENAAVVLTSARE